MVSRSLRRRELRRRRVQPAEPCRVSLTLTGSLEHVSQSFLILPGVQQQVILAAYLRNELGVSTVHLPVVVEAHLS